MYTFLSFINKLYLIFNTLINNINKIIWWQSYNSIKSREIKKDKKEDF